MSTGSAAIPLLKAAPDASQIAERLADGPWRGLEIALMPADVADDAAVERADRGRRAGPPKELTLTAEAPVSWPSGAFVSVDRLTDEARACIVRSADFAAAIGSPVLTIHLYAPVSARGVPHGPAARRRRDPAVPALLRRLTCLDRGITPLIENVPPVLRMRVGGVFLSADRRPLARPAPLARARPRAALHASTRRTRRSSATSPRRTARSSGSPPTRSSASRPTSRSSGPRSRSRTSRTRTACSARGFRSARGELDLAPVIAAGSASSARSSSRRSTSPTRRARPT